MGTDENVPAGRPTGARARIFAFAALASLAAGLAYVGQQSYQAMTDSFVAPIILSPDSDIVIQGKIHASQLATERAHTAADLEAIKEALKEGESAIARLKSLQHSPQSANAYTNDVNGRVVAASAAEEKMLKDQRAVLAEMAAKQERLIADGKKNLEAGLISKGELTKELQTQDELQLSMLENERSLHQVRTTMQQAASAQESLAGHAPAMPETLSREAEMVRIELEIARIESDARAKKFEKKLLDDKMAMLDDLDAQMKTRPAFRASERSMDVAFVPYTQMNGVFAGAVVHECVWGIFNCKAVGTVTELVPGEVILPDPWGNQARGQFAVLSLSNHDSAKAKTLRIRPTETPKRKPTENAERVSVK